MPPPSVVCLGVRITTPPSFAPLRLGVARNPILWESLGTDPLNTFSFTFLRLNVHFARWVFRPIASGSGGGSGDPPHGDSHRQGRNLKMDVKMTPKIATACPPRIYGFCLRHEPARFDFGRRCFPILRGQASLRQVGVLAGLPASPNGAPLRSRLAELSAPLRSRLVWLTAGRYLFRRWRDMSRIDSRRISPTPTTSRISATLKTGYLIT